MYHYRESGLENVYLTNGFREITRGENTYVAIDDVDGLHQAIAKTIINKPAPLTGPELRFLRLEMDLSQVMLARVIRSNEQSIAKWEKGETKKGIPGSTEILVRVIAKERLLKQDGPVSELIETLAKLDRQVVHRLNFAETEDGWKQAA